MTKRETKRENKARATLYHHAALAFGYNELAKLAEKFSERVYFGLAREAALDQLRKDGGDVDITCKPVLLTLGFRPPFILFTEDDIESMRKTVVEHDEITKKEKG